MGTFTAANLNDSPILWSDNGNHYAFIPGKISWERAKMEAESLTFQGVPGHLVTITSRAEDEFLLDSFGLKPNVWIGASDAEEEGVWKWVTGPETGLVFWFGGPINNAYENWSLGEPNNVGIENFAVWNHQISTGEILFSWNDVNNDPDDEDPFNRISGYLVEFETGSNGSEISLPTRLLDFSEFVWDLDQNGSIMDVDDPVDAYDGGLILSEFPFFDNAQTEDNGREIVIGTANIGDIEVTRKVYVPEDQSWARFLEIITNTGASTADFTVSLDTDLGSDGETFIVDTSSGDTTFNTDDNWLITDDFDGGGDPTLLHILAGEDGEIQPDAASLNFDDINFQYNLTLAPGETQIVMHFGAQNSDQATALSKAPELEALELDALEGMSQEELEQVVNFSIGPPVELIGSPDDDILSGTNRGDLISGLGGNDLLQGLGGNDQILGGSGEDLVSAGRGNDTVEGENGNDNISGNDGNDDLRGGDGQDNILGGDGNDLIGGGAEADRLLGEAGDDTIDGGSGQDSLLGGEGNDQLFGGAQADLIFGDLGDDSLSGNNGNDLIFGNSGNDSLSGDEGQDILRGGLDNDSLNGGAGNDLLIGVDPLIEGGYAGIGEIDTLTGGASSDIFALGDEDGVYYNDDDTGPIPIGIGESDFALITDFDYRQDFIQLSGSAEFYSLDFYADYDLGITNASLLFDSGDEGALELIAILQDVSTDLNIADSAFTFV